MLRTFYYCIAYRLLHYISARIILLEKYPNKSWCWLIIEKQLLYVVRVRIIMRKKRSPTKRTIQWTLTYSSTKLLPTITRNETKWQLTAFSDNMHAQNSHEAFKNILNNAPRNTQRPFRLYHRGKLIILWKSLQKHIGQMAKELLRANLKSMKYRLWCDDTIF